MSIQAESGPLDRMIFVYTPNSLLKRQTRAEATTPTATATRWAAAKSSV
ncbi:hypothetical protein [Paenibacillus medicaginis]